ncbi:MAG: DNA (cytosine-5-)-methyltransferase, partial [Ilumatobacteraceae bacterium]
GMQTVFQCEWDKHANTILHKHWPDVPKWEDVSTLTGKHILTHAPVIDVVAWGSPCQDLSVAGKRSGLEGERSGLFHEGIRIIKELRKESNGQYPRISIWENVVGALNSNRGADFGIIINEMAEAGAMVIEWAVLDAQYFGVPQRRRRVFVIAIFDPAIAERCPNPLLPVAESLPGHLAKGKQARKSAARTLTEGIRTDGAIVNAIGASLYHHGTVVNQDANAGHLMVELDVVGALAARDFKGVGNQYVNENKCVVEPAIVFNDDRRIGPTIHGDTVSTLQAFMGTGGNNTPMVAQNTEPPMLLDIQRVGDIRVYTEPVQALQARMGTGGNATPMLAYPIQDGRDIEKHQNGLGVGEEHSPAYTIDQTGAQAVAYGIQGNMIGRQDHNGPAGKGHTEEGEPMFTLTGTDIHAVSQEQPTMAVRRLTPLECERLMGWPDDHTRWKADGTEQADTHRYKQCGNG